jgi:hypothetical protein
MEKTLQDVLPIGEPSLDFSFAEADNVKEIERVLHKLDAEKKLVLKLLALGMAELEPADIRLLA